MKRGCCVAEQIKRQTVRGEEEGDSDEMRAKRQGEAGGKLKNKETNKKRNDCCLERWV